MTGHSLRPVSLGQVKDRVAGARTEYIALRQLHKVTNYRGLCLPGQLFHLGLWNAGDHSDVFIDQPLHQTMLQLRLRKNKVCIDQAQFLQDVLEYCFVFEFSAFQE